MKVITNFLLIISTLLLCPAIYADYAVSLSELKLMPHFCRGMSIGNLQDDAKHLHRKMHVPGQHTQHYCHGIKRIIRGDRAEFTKLGAGRGQYSAAVNEFDYVQSHSSKKHALIPSTSLYRAEALAKMGRTLDALKEYNKAISLKRKYPAAYAKLADYYIKLNQQQNALNTAWIQI